MLGGMLFYPAALAPPVLRNFGAAMAAAPDGVGAGTSCSAPLDGEPVDGQPVAGVIACFAGPLAEGEPALRPLREFGPPLLDTVGPMPYVAFQRLVDAGYPAGMRNYWTGEFLTGVARRRRSTSCVASTAPRHRRDQILALPGGGATARVPEGTMAISERGAPFNVHVTSLWPDPGHDAENIAWTRALGRP